MAYQNFIPEVWAAAIERDLERLCVFSEDCNRKYEGSVKDVGESVKILGVGKPTIKSMERANAGNNIDGPEEIDDTSVNMVIDQIRYFNYMVADIDKAQAKDGIMEALSMETSEGLANAVDTYIAGKVTDKSVPKMFQTIPKVVTGTASSGEINVLDLLDDAVTMLYENDVSSSTKIIADVSPAFYKLFLREYTGRDTDNSDAMKNGKIKIYNGITVKMSNNVCKSGTTHNMMLRTQRAIAYVQPKTHTEAFRPEAKFADAVKGFILFGSKVVRPKEIINMNVKFV